MRFKGTTSTPFSAKRKTNKTPAKYSASSEGTTSPETDEEDRRRKIPRNLGLGPSGNNLENQSVFDLISSPEAIIDEEPELQTNDGVMESAPFVFPSWEVFDALSPAETKEAYLNIQKEYISTKQRLKIMETSQNAMIAEMKIMETSQNAMTAEMKEMKRQISQNTTKLQRNESDVVPPVGVVPPPPDDATFEQRFIYCMQQYELSKEMRIKEEEEKEFERREKERKKNNFVIYGLPLDKNLSSEQKKEYDRKMIYQIIEKAGHSPDVIKSFHRMGSGRDRDGNESRYPRLLKVEMNSSEAKKAVMREQRQIMEEIPELNEHREEYSQYFRHDLTDKERQEYAERVQERNELNKNLPEGAPRWKVYKGKVSQHVSNSGNGGIPI